MAVALPWHRLSVGDCLLAGQPHWSQQQFVCADGSAPIAAEQAEAQRGPLESDSDKAKVCMSASLIGDGNCDCADCSDETTAAEFVKDFRDTACGVSSSLPLHDALLLGIGGTIALACVLLRVLYVYVPPLAARIDGDVAHVMERLQTRFGAGDAPAAEMGEAAYIPLEDQDPNPSPSPRR